MFEDTFDNILLTCRTCLNVTPELIPLCENNLALLLKECTSIEITEADIVKSICQICRIELENFHTFRLKCQKSNSYIVNLLKTEAPTETLNDESFHEIDPSKETLIRSYLPDVEYGGDQYNVDNSESDHNEVDSKNVKKFEIPEKIPEKRLKTANKLITRKKSTRIKNILNKKTNKKTRNAKPLNDVTTDAADITIPEIAKTVYPKNENLNEEDLKDVKPETFPCQKCQKIFGTKKRLSAHMRKHQTFRPYACHLCAKRYPQIGQLASHMKTSHSMKAEFKCEDCGREFYVEVALNKHMNAKHSDLKCRVCGKQFKEIRILRDHETHVHTVSAPRYCQQCDVTFKRDRSYRQHMNRHNGVDFRKICNVCGLKFTNIRMHMYNAHNIGTIDKFTCRRCGETFTDAKSSRIHAKNLHRKKHAPEEYVFQCTVCDKRLLTKANLERHYQVIHTNASRIRNCDVCGKLFKTKQELENHVRTHTGERPFPCDFCDMKFRTKKTMVTHRRLHTGEKPYVCEICNKAFSHYSTFAPHKKRHLQNFYT